jgi:hypothetical protein
MTNIYGTPDKVERRDRLWEIGLQTLEEQGWRVERVSGSGKSSMRRLRKSALVKLATIRTTQDRWFAFPRTKGDTGWLTLDEVDTVVVVSVDSRETPKFAHVHMFDQSEVKTRFDRAYAARMKAGRSIPVGRGVWVSLYEQDDGSPNLAGAGIGTVSPPIAMVALKKGDHELAPQPVAQPRAGDSVRPLTMNEAKQGLALTFGVDPSQIKITIEA